MFRIYKWGDDVPSWIAEVSGVLPGSVKFSGLVISYKYKGEIILKPILGESVIKIDSGVGCHVSFKDVVIKPKSSPLNILRIIRYILFNFKT
tara:strand:- start:615 stop:890 length:276 start_codon:yes stop_codon:yes gene_type:complete